MEIACWFPAKTAWPTTGIDAPTPTLGRQCIIDSPGNVDTNAMPAAEISVIVPTLNEAANLPELARRIALALIGRDYEVIIVDDNSPDSTGDVCRQLQGNYPLRLLVRKEPKNGLSGAVLEGIAQAAGRYIVVMDADLQHPPEKIPELLGPLESGAADFVLGSRYVEGGGTEQGWGLFRWINSRVATLLARPLAGRTRDPMSGFFALARQTLENAQLLTPLGYKIALELLTKCRVKTVREIPIHLAARQKGESKLTLAQQFKYLEHLSRLYDFTFPRLAPMFKFLIAVGIGWGVALALFRTVLWMGAPLAWAPGLAYPAAILSTAVFHLRYVRTQYEFLIRPRPWLDFCIISAAEWAVCTLSALWFVARVAQPAALELFVFSCGAATMARYVLRKEFLQDLRGLRKEPRQENIIARRR